MTDQTVGSMFEYDARPATPQVVIVGRRASSGGYLLRDFLSRNGVPYEWVEADDADRVRTLLPTGDVDRDRLPICVLPDGSTVVTATVAAVAAGLGLVSLPLLADYDQAIIGAGPAGLAAAVYGASEGLRTVAVEAVAPGGQAGTTSMIENYLGFPQGISGSELATRANAQARRFGAEVLLARPVVDISNDGPRYVVRLSDGTEVPSRSVLVASGVEWRRLEVPGLEALLGAGVYYGAGPSEAVSCRGCRVAIVGGGNSAGQAVDPAVGCREIGEVRLVGDGQPHRALRRAFNVAGSAEQGVGVAAPVDAGVVLAQPPQSRRQPEIGLSGLAGRERLLERPAGVVPPALTQGGIGVGERFLAGHEPILSLSFRAGTESVDHIPM
ncbi:MAG: NAD(P)/FAD-dependent oxidoreductase [Acidimicrobiales bacterium]